LYGAYRRGPLAFVRCVGSRLDRLGELCETKLADGDDRGRLDVHHWLSSSGDVTQQDPEEGCGLLGRVPPESLGQL
jgi:hypothetical protein